MAKKRPGLFDPAEKFFKKSSTGKIGLAFSAKNVEKALLKKGVLIKYKA